MDKRATSGIRLLATALLLSGVILEGQSTSGSILGLVSDPSRGLVVEAEVSVQNEGTLLTRTVRTNAEGTFLVPSLPPGMYRVTVKKSGFKSLTREGLLLAVDQKLSLDLALSVGDVAETVSVTGAAPVLQTQSVETGQVIGSRQILDLPLLGRNFLDLTLLIPGVAAGGGGNGANYSVNGQREFANSIVVNGIEITGNRNNDNSISPSVDAVEEFKAVTSGYAPEFGRAAGGVIAVQIKSGTNGFHGSAYEFLRTNATTARTFFAPEPSQLKQHNFGASLGGPIIRNKTFFFASYEGFRVRDVFSYFDTTVPSGMIHYLPDGGVDLSHLRDPNTGNQIPIFDPDFYNTNFYSQQFEENIIPASRVSPAGRNILQKLFPAPNVPGVANGWFSNYSVEQRYKDNSTSGDMRLDHIFSSNDRISATYDVGDGDSQTGDRFAGAIPIAGGGSTDGADKTHSRTDVAGITYTRVMSPSQVNELRVSYLHTDLRQDDLLFGSNLADKLGVGNVNLSGFPATSGFPQIFLGFGASTGGSTYKPLTFSDQNVQVTDNYSWIRGQHALKFGYDFRRLVANPNFAVFPTGYQYYYGAYSSLTSDPTYGFYDPSAYYGNGGNEIADLLLGLPGAVVEGLQLTNAQSRSYEHHFYVQDVWQVNPKLVLTYGVRYEYQAPYTEAHNRASNFDIATKSMLLAGKGGHLDSLLEPDKNNFAPRLGIAWRAMPKTSVRAGWGFFYTPENDGRSDVLAHNFPFFTEQQYLNSPGSPYSYTLDQGVPRPTSIPVPPGASSIDLTKIPDAKVESVFVADTNFRTGYSQMADFMLEQELTSHFTVEAGYVGAFARKLPYAIGNVNRQNRISDLLGNIEGQFPIGNSNYHSLQLKLDKRFSSGFSFLASYTFSKSIDNGPAPFNLGPRTQQWPQDPFNLTLERALSASDLTHNFVFSGIWEVPIARNSHGFRRAAFGGWQLNTILVMHSGLPVNVIRNSRAPGGYEGLRPNLVANPNLSGDDRTLKHYFNTAAFSTTGLGPTDIGTAGRNLVRAPGLINCDLSLFKDLPLREKLVLQVRIEAFNVSNTPHFGAPSGDMSQGDFGAINGTSGIPRIMQFAAKLKF